MSVATVLPVIEQWVGRVDPGRVDAVGGGSINRSYAFTGADGERFFLKINRVQLHGMFEAERDGLAELEGAGAVRVPRPIASGAAGGAAYLLLEGLDLAESGGRAAAADSAAGQLGKRLAAQHRVMSDEFGWHRDNTIGLTPQINTRTDNWIEFLRDSRLGFQLRLAAKNGIAADVVAAGNELLARLPDWFADYTPEASLLHGDLWGGNWGVLPDGQPVIFDPAVYFGDREADIAMTMLFGGFGAGFLEAYESSWPLDPGFSHRIELYNLYHVLNHFNLFGGGYARQALAMLNSLLA
ncbi:MAG: fructosamine kinase family protein [Gammaproteobacteria bacterium]